ncbi:hypothetical protein P8452_15110 [Trifolium repens]|nr:hypothetical protein P8452_15110 [Trifolium repens]
MKFLRPRAISGGSGSGVTAVCLSESGGSDGCFVPSVNGASLLVTYLFIGVADGGEKSNTLKPVSSKSTCSVSGGLGGGETMAEPPAISISAFTVYRSASGGFGGGKTVSEHPAA